MKMKIAAFLTLLAVPAFAADEAPKPLAPKGPTCGKTAEDCQKVVDDAEKRIQRQASTIAALVQQRNSIRTAADDAEVVNFVNQQADAAAKK